MGLLPYRGLSGTREGPYLPTPINQLGDAKGHSMTTGKLLATAGILLALVSLSFLPAAAQSYTVTDLGTLPGGKFSSALAINDLGVVAGFSSIPSGNDHAFIWSSIGGMIDLGALNQNDSIATGINNSGQVVGNSIASGFIWTQSGGMQDIGNLGGLGTYAYGINNLGQVVGNSTLSDNLTVRAFLWTSTGGMQDLGTLGGNGSVAYAINDSGQVVGYSSLADNVTTHAFLWTQDGGMQDLGTLGGIYSSALAISGSGEVTGWSSLASGLETPFLWNSNRGMVAIGVPNQNASGLGVNDAAQVVGLAEIQRGLGFLWTKKSGMQNLNGLVPKGNQIVEANGINRSGMIAASGKSRHALLLTPTK
jgi:probable HAF family extracellular repeat protein